MKEYIYTLLQNSKALSLEQILLQTLVALILGFAIFLSYWLSHVGTSYSSRFNVSLIMLTILTSTVMAIIGTNVALSLGMVGALSIVRYRTAIKDSRDTAYIFWAIVAGICSGSGDFLIGAIGSAAIFLVLLFLGKIKNDSRLLLIIRGNRQQERDIEAFVYLHFGKRINLKVKNTTGDTIEFIYAVSKKDYDVANKNVDLLEEFYALGQIEYINFVAQSDEII